MIHEGQSTVGTTDARAPQRTSTERPRDRWGRPLPWGENGFPTVPPRAWISSEDAIAQAVDYLSEDLPFHAHEVLEQRWRCCPPGESGLWRALAQWAAGATHAARGNARGARALRERGRAGVRQHGSGQAGDSASTERFADDLDRLIAALEVE